MEIDINLPAAEVDRIVDNLEQIAPALAAQVIGSGLRAAAEVVAKKARELAPKRTGFLARSIRARFASSFVNTSSGRRKVARTAAVVFTDAFYSVFVEYGTSRAGAQPFLGPASVQASASELLSAATSGSLKKYNQLAQQLAGEPSSQTKRLAAL